jgi:hypothetical protein
MTAPNPSLARRGCKEVPPLTKGRLGGVTEITAPMIETKKKDSGRAGMTENAGLDGSLPMSGKERWGRFAGSEHGGMILIKSLISLNIRVVIFPRSLSPCAVAGERES